MDLVDGEFAVIVCWGEGSAASSRGLFAWLRVWATTRRGWLIRSARGTMIDAEAAGAGRLIASFVDEPEVWGDEMADAKVNQERIEAFESELAGIVESWRKAWATAGRTERIKARYGIGCEARELIADYKDVRDPKKLSAAKKLPGSERPPYSKKVVHTRLNELTEDSTAAYQLLYVAKSFLEPTITKACETKSITWTHLLVVAWVEGREQQLEVFEECEANRWSAQKLQDWIIENYTITGGVEKTRFTVLTRSLGRMLEKTNRLVEQMLAADPRGKPQSTALAEAATRVKDSQSKEALKTLDATMEELKALKDQTVKLNQALRGARQLISKKVEQEG